MPKKRILFYTILFITIAAFLSIYVFNKIVSQAADGKLYSDINSIPYNKVGLLLGTSRYMEDGSINPCYAYRIEAAVNLLKAGKIKYIIVSGDNSRNEYNEPELMKADLIAAGIDSSVIFPDYAGF